MAELLFKSEVYAIIGAAIEVHRILGHGFLEPVYQEALELESRLRDLSFESQKVLQIQYKEFTLKKDYVADLVYFGTVLVELKALNALTAREESQILNYLKATGCQVGLLINFGSHGRLEWKRFARSAEEGIRSTSRPFA